jgi:hypothetical protein
MSKKSKKEERKRKQRGRRIIAERKAYFQEQKDKRTVSRLQKAREKIIIPLFLLLLFLFALFLVFFIAQDNSSAPKEEDAVKVSQERQRGGQALQGSFWLLPEGEKIESELLEKKGGVAVIYVYLNKEALLARKRFPDAFTYLLRSEKMRFSDNKKKLRARSLKPLRGKGFLLYPIKKSDWREFYLVNEKDNVVGFLLNNSGRNSKEDTLLLLRRLQIIEK